MKLKKKIRLFALISSWFGSRGKNSFLFNDFKYAPWCQNATPFLALKVTN